MAPEAGPSGERLPGARGEETTPSCPVSAQMLQVGQRPQERRGEGPKQLLPEGLPSEPSRGPCPGKGAAPKTRRPQGLPAAGEENRLAESLARRGPRSHGPQREDTTPRDSQGEREGPGSPQSEGGPSPLRLCETGFRDPRREVSPRRPSPYQETRSEVGVGDRLGPL